MIATWTLTLLAAVPPAAQDTYQRFRAANIDFADRVCVALSEHLSEIPLVALHGDAHLEQFVVTEDSAGLRDFDDAARGPAALDYVRFLGSIEIAGRLTGADPRDIERAGDAFARAYWTGSSTTPSLVKRVRRGFAASGSDRVTRNTSCVQTLPPDERIALSAQLIPFVRSVESKEGWEEGMLSIRDLGRLKLGIGSRNKRKYLARVRGKTERSDDDEFLEFKELSDLSGIRCLDRSSSDPRRRIQAAQAALLARPDPALGVVDIGGLLYWTHLWSHHYWEVDVRKISRHDLVEVAASAGAQLGRGHRRSSGGRDFVRMRSLQGKLRGVARTVVQAMIRR